ncbi:MAG: xanthan lyase [Bacteroidales bacterium]|nr:xanthan lyase [Bacteroidales bacterium]
MQRLLTVFAACILSVTVLSAQDVDKTVERSIAEYFKNYKSGRTALKHSGLDKRRNRIVVNKGARKVVIYANEAFAGQAFTPGVVDTIYRDIRKLLPSSLRKYKIEVVYDNRTIDERIPGIYRGKDVDNERLWGSEGYEGEPWVRNVSRPYEIGAGLQGRHLALWQSHGRVFSTDKGVWQWQRPSLFCTVEDLFTQSIVVPLLMPMLENAGAVVYTPRERDWQPECVIVDNDASRGESRYSEEDARALKWREYNVGYADAKEVYRDGDNPFAMGTSRFVTSTQDKKNRAEAAWHPGITKDGEYAVYVSYCSFENSVPDALYKVFHSGGSTEFRVNQLMGGGTWVYLGRFHFKAGDDTQCVVLCNESAHKGVVSADAVRFGGGMGVVARGEEGLTSGLPRYLEAARYNLQTGGFPKEVYSAYEGKNDYRDDILCRGHAVNYLTGGSPFNPDTTGLKVPLELSFGFHSDAGYDAEDNVIGSLGVVTTRFNGDTLGNGHPRAISRDAVSFLLNSVQEDISARYGFHWPVRGILDRNYGETRVPYIPSVIFESLSHQNYIDMAYGHNPDFKFTMARAVYKSLLKHLCFVNGQEFVVQPLPVSHFSMSLSEDAKEVTLRWRPVNDPQEPTAKPKRYVVYTRKGDGGFDNGVVADKNSIVLPVEKGVLYGFKVTALNDGGESLSSEVLSMYVSKNEKGRVLVVNGFHRLSGPEAMSTPQTAGFDMEYDPGVPYMYSPEYCGVQLDHSRAGIGFEDGLGLSDDRYEGLLVAGNTFDYPRVHGVSLAANDFSFVSCSSEAVMSGDVKLGDYKVVDIILGVEKQGEQGSYLGYNRPYKTFPKELQDKVRAFCKAGGNLFVSGAFIASDMTKTNADRAFVREVLRCDYGGSIENLAETGVTGNVSRVFRIPRTVNSGCYAVSRPDILVPLDDAFVSFVFDGCRESAGVAYAGDYRVLSTSFPFEAVQDENARNELMGAVMRFLLR